MDAKHDKPRNFLLTAGSEWNEHRRTHDGVHGLRAYREVGQLSESPDLAIVCTPAKTVPAIVGQCRDAGVGGVILLSAGFREAGKEGAELEQSVRAAGGDFEQLRAVGPNCLGILAPHHTDRAGTTAPVCGSTTPHCSAFSTTSNVVGCRFTVRRSDRRLLQTPKGRGSD